MATVKQAQEAWDVLEFMRLTALRAWRDGLTWSHRAGISQHRAKAKACRSAQDRLTARIQASRLGAADPHYGELVQALGACGQPHLEETVCEAAANIVRSWDMAS